VALSDAGGGAAIGVNNNCTVQILDDDGPASFDPIFTIGQSALDGPVNSVAVQPDGRLVIGGQFQQLALTSRRGVARLNPDGSLDATFDPGVGLYYSYGGGAGWLNLIRPQPDGKLLIAGIFTSVNGTNQNFLARLNPNGSLDTSFNDGSGPWATGNILGDIRGMELLADGRIIAAGGFNTYNGVARNGLVRLSTNGMVDTAYQPTGGSIVNTIGLQADGKVAFSLFNGTSVSRINSDGTTTRTNADGSTNIILVASANNYIRQVSSLPGGITMMAGSFTSVNGQDRRCLARTLADGSIDPAFIPDLGLFTNATTAPYVYKFTVQPDGKVLAALKSYAAPKGNYLVRLNNDGALDTDFEPVNFAIPIGDNDLVSDIKIQADNQIIVAGQFQTVNGLPRPYLVRLKGGGNSGNRLLFVKSMVKSAAQCSLSLAVSPTKPFVLQVSTNMVVWQDVTTNTVLTSVFNVVDSQIGSASQRFYRVKQLVP